MNLYTRNSFSHSVTSRTARNAAGEMTPPQSPHSLNVQVLQSGPIKIDIQQIDNKTKTEASRELPLPTVTQINSLAQAQATLEHCLHRLIAIVSRPDTSMSADSFAILVPSNRQQYHPWLEQWERAFAKYLSGAMRGMNPSDVNRSRLLKANHLASTVVASAASIEPSAWTKFMPEYEAVVELTAAVLAADPSLTFESRRNSSSQSYLSVREPLYVVLARCGRRSLQQKALAVLARCPRARALDQSLLNTNNLHRVAQYGQPIITPTSPAESGIWIDNALLDAAHTKR